jgi:hypothetical protein
MTDAPQDPEFVLRGVAGTAFGRSYHLLSPTTLGRSPECDICLDEPGISRLHAKLKPTDFGLEIEDNDSTNGTFLNGQRVGMAIARVGDEVAFDRLRFRVAQVRKEAVATTQAPAATRPGRDQASATPSRWRWPLVALVFAATALALLATRGL